MWLLYYQTDSSGHWQSKTSVFNGSQLVNTIPFSSQKVSNCPIPGWFFWGKHWKKATKIYKKRWAAPVHVRTFGPEIIVSNKPAMAAVLKRRCHRLELWLFFITLVLVYNSLVGAFFSNLKNYPSNWLGSSSPNTGKMKKWNYHLVKLSPSSICKFW